MTGWRQAYAECVGEVGVEAVRRLERARAAAAARAADPDDAGPSLALEPEDRVPLSPANWIENEYFSGPLARRMWPALKEVFVDICDRRIFEVVGGGGIGYGKSTLVRALHARSKYLLSCPARPHESFARPLIETAPIVFVNMNVSDDKAYAAYFAELTALFDATPYFKEQFPRQRNLKHRLVFPRAIESTYAGASKTAAESENMVFCFMDEANLYDNVERSKRSDEGGKYDEAKIVHAAARYRMMSRFMNPADGSYPEAAKLVVMCKETYKDSFVRRRIQEIRAQGLDRDEVVDGKVARRASAIVLEYPTWGMWPHDPHRKYFWIVTETRSEPARIVDDRRRAHEIKERAGADKKAGRPEDEVPEVIAVPTAGGEMRRMADEDLDLFLRDACGKATDAIRRFIKDRRLLLDAILPAETGRRAGIPEGASAGYIHPFTADETNLRDGVQLLEPVLAEERVIVDKLTGKEVPEWRPLRSPDAARFVHIDLGLSNDSAGIAMSHASGYVPIASEEAGDEDGEGRKSGGVIMRPVAMLDFALRINPPPNSQIPYARIAALLRRLVELGFRIVRVTADGYQSAMLLQAAGDMGIDNEVLSLDKTPDPYMGFRTMLREGRVACYDYPPLLSEAGALELIKSRRVSNGKTVYVERIDHPPKGCFVGRTRIPLLDGTMPEIGSLVGKEVWIYSSLPSGGIVPGRARGRDAGSVSELVDVVLDSGAIERCTPDHWWRMWDGSYKAACDLRPGIDRLMPISRQWPVNGGYERVVDLLGNRVLTHHLVWAYFNGPVPIDGLVHHVNHCKTDNRPENLEAATWGEHSREHTMLRHRIDPAWRAALYEGARAFNESDGGRRKHSDAIRRTMAAMTTKEILSRARANPRFRSDIDLARLEAIVSDPEARNANAAARILGCGRNVVTRVLVESGFGSWGEFHDKLHPGNNHKIRAVVPVHLSRAESVFDLEVDDHSNFALASGVFVHNSKDVADAAAGSAWGVETCHLKYAGGQAGFVDGERHLPEDKIRHSEAMKQRDDFMAGRWEKMFERDS